MHQPPGLPGRRHFQPDTAQPTHSPGGESPAIPALQSIPSLTTLRPRAHTTFILWRPWPAGMTPARRPGMTSTEPMEACRQAEEQFGLCARWTGTCCAGCDSHRPQGGRCWRGHDGVVAEHQVVAVLTDPGGPVLVSVVA